MAVAACLVVAVTCAQTEQIGTQPEAAAPTVSALERLPAECREAVKRRAKFVYELPDGSVWDGYWYFEFRRVLAAYDRAKGKSVPAECAAWGFSEERRGPGKKDSRPHPLWRCVSSDKDYTPFYYIDSGKQAGGRQAEVGKEVGERVYEVTLREFPGASSSDSLWLPYSFHLGFARIAVEIPASMGIKEGDELVGEYFFLRDEETPDPKNPGQRAYKVVHASDLRMTPERYAAAVLEGRVEIVEWDWKKETGRLGPRYEWTRTVVECGEAER